MTLRKLRLCYYGDPNSIHTKRWLMFFAQRGHHVHLINDSGGPVSIDSVTVHDCSLTTRRLPFRWTEHWYKLRSLLHNQIRPEIFHAHCVTSYGYWSALTFYHPLVLTPWGSDVLLTSKKSAFHHLASRFALRSSDLITVESEILRKEVLALGADPGKIQRVIWGVDFEQLASRNTSALIKQELNIPNDGFVILSMRNFRPLYNHTTILEAIPKTLQALPEAYFIFVGGGEQKAELEELGEKLGVTANLRILAEQPHSKVRDFMDLANVYISIPSSDSISTTLLEAMASGKPVIVSDIPANREWVTNKTNGLVILPDSNAVAKAVITLAKHQPLSRSLGARNKEKVRQDADHTANMLKMEELYFALVRAASPRIERQEL